MHIGLYDIDLHHSPNPVLNLELMKIFNYYYSKGLKITMMRPQDDEGRFSKIIYFKDSPALQIPKGLVLTGNNKHIYGYGFYNSVSPLPQPLCAAAPSFLPYDPYMNKIYSTKYYNSIKNSSLIRIETNDFTGVKEGSKKIYLVDRNPARLDLIGFISKFPENQKFYLLHNLYINSLEDYNRLKANAHQFMCPFSINFPFDGQFFLTHHDESFAYDMKKFPNESTDNFLRRIIQMILIFKRDENRGFRYGFKRNDLLGRIFQWGDSDCSLSYCEYYKNCKEALKEAESLPKEIRLLLKQKPKNYNPITLDF